MVAQGLVAVTDQLITAVFLWDDPVHTTIGLWASGVKFIRIKRAYATLGFYIYHTALLSYT